MRRSLLTVLVGLLAVGGATAPARAATVAEPVVAKTTACLPVQAGGATQPVYATRFTAGAPTQSTPVLVLVHGVASNADIFDLSEQDSVARSLARAGYVVVAYDRLGYSRSPYRGAGDGHDLTVDVQQQVLHQVVAHVKAGDFATGAQADCTGGSTPAPAATTTPGSRVVIIGHSQGGFIVSSYPGRYPGDVAGMVQADAPSGAFYFDRNGLPIAENIAYQDPVTQQEGSDLPSSTDAQGYQQPTATHEQCATFNVWAPGAVPALVDAFCDDHSKYVATPAGDGESQVTAAQAGAKLITQTGATKVLQITGDHDPVLPPGTAGREYNQFAGRCGCDISHAVIANTGHAFMLHTSLPVWLATVEGWLDSKGLAGDPVASDVPAGDTPAPAPTTSTTSAPAPAPATVTPAPAAVTAGARSLPPLALSSVVAVPKAGCLAGGRLVLRARRARLPEVQRLTALVGGHRLTARTGAITVSLRRSTQVRIGLVLLDGRTAHVTRRFRPCRVQ